LRKLLGFVALLWAFSAGAFQGLSCEAFLQGVSYQGFPVRLAYRGTRKKAPVYQTIFRRKLL